ncbi:MAG: cyclic nucleotide-binding domain-containing protein [Lachnospiraceae bacterium]|nr:cyclic nucleotide-binding domain-containing protein [Lachnospiraceae bacterium]
MTINSVNQFKTDEVLYSEGDAPGCIYMVLKGKVRVKGKGYAVTLGAGSLVGLEQLQENAAADQCYALEEASIYVLNANSQKNLSALLASNKDYNGISVFNHAYLLKEYEKQRRLLLQEAVAIYAEIKDLYDKYLYLVQSTGCKAGMIPEIGELPEPPACPQEDMLRVNCLLDYGKIPLDVMKAFYAPCRQVVIEAIMDLQSIEEKLQASCNELSDYLIHIFMLEVGDDTYSLFRNALGLGIEMKHNGISPVQVEEIAKACIARRNRIKKIITETTGRTWYDNDAEIRTLYEGYLSGEDFRADDEASNATSGDVIMTVDSCKDTMQQLFDFGEFPEDKQAELSAAVDEYMALEDRESTEEPVRKLRQKLANLYYDLYYRVAVKYFEMGVGPAAVELFMDFGLLSEKLITHDELVELVSVKAKYADRMTYPESEVSAASATKSRRGRSAAKSVEAPSQASSDTCAVYTMSRWLKLIYSGKKEPSRNSMGQDYSEMLREMKKNGTITEQVEKQLLTDRKRKLEHEIKEVLQAGNRVVNGQLSIFVPFIHSGMFMGNLEKAYCSAQRINDEVAKVLSIDFSVFYRESLYVNKAAGLEKEYVMKQVMPEFILYPMVGQNVIMWQEITGRKRDSEGRFFAPSFTYTDFFNILVKALGRYRWDLCKTIQGANWNNIQVHSLTSEYSDYIQFYKKNHDLSDDRKEKIKLQIQRGRNNLREIFTLDYEVWIRNEATGSVKLNKVVREMLATYCPFAAEIRKRIGTQPLYEEAFARDIRERGKKGRELQLRLKGLETKGADIPEELKETLKFYREM